MKIAVLDRGTLGDDISLDALANVGELFVYERTFPEQVADRISDCEVVVVNKIKLNKSNLCVAKHLRLICLTATGYDNVDCSYCRERGIAVCNVVGYSTQSVAQLTVAMALSLLHHLPTYTNYVQDGRYTQSGVANRLIPPYRETYGMTWGIVGYGNIGMRVADVARALGCHVLAYSRTPKDGVENVNIEELCRRSDIISLHTPLHEGTRHLIGEHMLDLMKPSAILINVARGGVWKEDAVVRYLLEGRIGGVGSDVYSVEPFGDDHPFYAIRNHPCVCLTPHMAWSAYEARVRLLEEVAQNIIAFESGIMRNRIV